MSTASSRWTYTATATSAAASLIDDAWHDGLCGDDEDCAKDGKLSKIEFDV